MGATLSGRLAQRLLEPHRAVVGQPHDAVAEVLDPAVARERLGERVAERAAEVRCVLGGVEALEREAPPVSAQPRRLHAQRAEDLEAARPEADRAVRPLAHRLGLAQRAVERDPEAAGQVVVAGARGGERALLALRRPGDAAGEPVEGADEDRQAPVGELVADVAAVALAAHEAGVAEALEVVGELGERDAEQRRQLAGARRPGVAEAVDYAQAQGISELLEERHPRIVVIFQITLNHQRHISG